MLAFVVATNWSIAHGAGVGVGPGSVVGEFSNVQQIRARGPGPHTEKAHLRRCIRDHTKIGR